MKNEIFHAMSKSHAGTDEKHDINFHWLKSRGILKETESFSGQQQAKKITEERSFAGLYFHTQLMLTYMCTMELDYTPNCLSGRLIKEKCVTYEKQAARVLFLRTNAIRTKPSHS